MSDEQTLIIKCPACTEKVFSGAIECPKCGYRGPGAHLEQLLTNIGTMSSIFVGFDLAAIVGLVGSDPEIRNTTAGWLAAGSWIVASALLLMGLLMCEGVRSTSLRGKRMQMPIEDETQVGDTAARLVFILIVALAITMFGVACVAVLFSWLFLSYAAAATALVTLAVWRLTRP